MKIAISVPVHENMEVVFDQIANIRYFVPESIIVIHVSRQFTGWNGYGISDLKRLDNVEINPTRMNTSLLAGVQCDLHLSNFRYIDSIENIDYFNLHSSNELFISHGVKDYVLGYDAGFFDTKLSRTSAWKYSNQALNDRILLDIMRKHGIDTVLLSQIEGSFYKSKTFRGLSDILHAEGGRALVVNSLLGSPTLQKIPRLTRNIRRVYNRLTPKAPLYPREEVYFPTIASRLELRKGYPYCYSNWGNNLRLSIEEIDACVNKDVSRLTDVEKSSGRRFFTVKRVPRTMDDPIRVYIRGLTRR